MKRLRKFLDKQEKHFTKGGKLESLFYLYEVFDVFLYSRKVTKSASHVRDAIDLKRVMIMVVFALIPAVLMAMYNTGLQANLALSKIGEVTIQTWQQGLLSTLGISFDPKNIFANIAHGAFYFLPV